MKIITNEAEMNIFVESLLPFFTSLYKEESLPILKEKLKLITYFFFWNQSKQVSKETKRFQNSIIQTKYNEFLGLPITMCLNHTQMLPLLVKEDSKLSLKPTIIFNEVELNSLGQVSVLHEIIHAIESEYIDQTVFVGVSANNLVRTTEKERLILAKGRLTTEVITQYRALQGLSYLKTLNTIVMKMENERIPAYTEELFPLVEPFYEEFKEVWNHVSLYHDYDLLFKRVGLENLEEYFDIVNQYDRNKKERSKLLRKGKELFNQIKK